jgi:glycosyltransferase involved in cell wall biosynthesis
MRILHLIDARSSGGGACVMKLATEPIARIRSIEHVVLLVGHGDDGALAERCGLRIDGRIGAIAGRPALARRQLARAIDAYARAGEPVDLVHAWSPEATLLALASGIDVRVVGTLTIGPAAGLRTQALIMALDERPAPLLALTPTLASEWAMAGVQPSTIHVLPPAVNPAALHADESARLAHRRRWRAGARSMVVGAVGEPAEWLDSRAAASVGLIAALAGHDVRIVIHSQAMRRRDTEDWLEEIGDPELLVVDDELAEPWRVLSSLDAAIVLAPARAEEDLRGMGSPFATILGGGRRVEPPPSILPALWAAGAGLPVLASRTPTFASIFEDGRSAFLTDPGDVNRAADGLMRLADDRQLGGRIGAAAADVVRRRFNVSAFCVRLKECYLQVAMDRPLKVAEVTPSDATPSDSLIGASR